MSKFIRLGWLLTFLMVGIIACNTGGDGGGFTVTVTSSSTNVTAISSITLTASATGGTLTTVQFLKNGAALGTPVTAAPFQTQVNLTSADNGSISFTATGTDSTGKTDTSDAVTVTVNIPPDVTPPTVSLSSSSANVTTAGTIDLTATATDDVGIARVEYFKNGNRIGQLFAAPFTFKAFITQDDNGTANFTAKAFDAAGNSGDSSPVPVTVNISVATLLRPSKSSAIAISGNDRYILQVNPENDSLTIFRSASNEKLAEVPVGDEPSSVVVHPDDISAFVAVRGEAKVVKIDDINTASASVVDEVDVGSEPTGIALSPSGKFLVVAEFAESRISIVDTDTMTIVGSREIRNPRAVAITNDGDTDDSDEKVVVTEFYGAINPGNVEGQNNSRTGVVRIFSLTAALTELEEVEFAPLATPDFAPTNETSPNQLYAVIITPDNSKFIALATASSPNGVASFNQNIYQLLLIGDMASGNVLGTINISAAIKTQVTGTKNFMGDIIDLSLVGNNIIYLASRAGDAFQRAVLSSNNTSVTLGSTFNKQVDLLVPKGCQAPIGVVTAHDVSDNKTMYFNCWMSRTMAAVDLASQSVIDDFASATPPSGLELEINKGRRFYFTGRARWANESWSSCGSCHPDGLSDNITWQFPAGPRQSTSMDGTYSKGAVQKMRILNWSGIFDELHDFERNTRGVSGGLGAITTGNPCGGDLSGETRTSLNPADATDPNGLKTTLGIPVKEVQDTTANCVPDWDEIDLFVKTIRPPLGKRFTSTASVNAGRALFTEGNCAACHGGAGWTLSRRFFEPSSATNADLATEPFTDLPIGGDNPHPTQIGAEPDGAAGIGPAQVSCVLRNVNTFGVPGDATATATLEVKGVAGAPKAQGQFAGYNIPSLYGLQVGAPFMHHGQAATLEEFLDPSGAWQDHLNAGNAVFAAGLTPAEVDDLVNFLLSIDADTTEFVVPANSEECPASF
jgi:DNA-binding beta-propeller fold protein YncE